MAVMRDVFCTWMGWASLLRFCIAWKRNDIKQSVLIKNPIDKKSLKKQNA